jgi:hypothetical protein
MVLRSRHVIMGAPMPDADVPDDEDWASDGEAPAMVNNAAADAA